jgi:hypothetical protein
LRSVASEIQAGIVAERGLLAEAQVLEILAELMTISERAFVPLEDVTVGLIERYGAEYERPITNRWIGGVLRRRLNLRTYKSHGIYVVPTTERTKIEALCARYGVYVITGIASPAPLGDVGTSGTS